MTQHTEELADCRHCNSRDSLKLARVRCPAGWYYVIRCAGCGAQGDSKLTPAAAKDSWNWNR